ncbi:peptide-methionine (S)-S-oxide reductase [Novosphingobium kunmingense]|uniref:Peptide methionine sulfoxide reductase MsrA n=1 Tax=Novosphingobium kunmingense TaxID=1211806 RepID=A0A2N0I487_9SPHN|nr:peptide-methionine (S)-S-oxide reductase MsrA [Novosphingobium kunmingense]PKB26001.1 peptide-methionine (S)-S-oxide reductase [Novosphingobium kunmingense]
MRAAPWIGITAALAIAFATFSQPKAAAPVSAAARVAPPAATAESGRQTAVLAGGCFWGIEALFEHVRGVTGVVSGYAGGTRQTATYDQVSSERTGHAEAVRITYDPAQISYGQLLQIFFYAAHDPTQLNRQTPDEGPSYRSAIFPQNAQQRATAEAYVAALNKARAFGKPVATKVESGQFFAAERYHQDFMRRNPVHPYILRWDAPKLRAFRAAFPARYVAAF